MAQTYTVKAGDTLNAIAAKYGFSNYKAAGISGYGSNPDAIQVGQVLTIGGATAPAPTPTPTPTGTGGGTGTPTPQTFTTPSGAVVDATGKLITPPPSVATTINSGQQQDQQTAQNASSPTVSGGAQSLIDAYKSLAEALKPSTPKPTAPDLTQTFSTLRANMGVDTLESQLADLNKQKADLQAQLYGQQLNEQGKPVAMNVIEGRMTEEQAQAAQKLAVIDASISSTNSQLTTKYNVIQNLMSYTNTDYQNAKQEYDQQFSQNLQMIQLTKGITDTANTQAEQAKDDARANLQIIYNNLTSSGSSVDSLDPTMKSTVTKLELQAGLPSGFFDTLVSKNPKANIVSTTTRVSGGVKYADVLMRGEDGSLTTQTVKLGATTEGSSPSNATTQKGGYGIINQLAQPNVTMSDGTPYMYKAADGNYYLTAAGFSTLVEAAAESGISRSDFIDQYAGKLDPNGASGYHLTPKEQQNLGI